MFACILTVNLPIPDEESGSKTSNFRVAEFDFDPGWQIEDDVYINDAALTVTRRSGRRVREESDPHSYKAKRP